jgi:thiazole synthase ThiGH ThiG subunit
MAAAFAQAVAAGRSARRAGLMPVGTDAQASSPLTAFLQGGERA